ncbi:hypothetical protein CAUPRSCDRAFT_10808 [Caulochytrium protostelioides]|uniref:FCH domain-containing protein n=1 Tax=Caulochytrium protostelioides TaxID=1555241 RepID=A0A4P9WW23_9FUNG|nr:hypothetical protein CAUPRSCDRAFT_10808 [Caulochytrium protostelioides]
MTVNAFRYNPWVESFVRHACDGDGDGDSTDSADDLTSDDLRLGAPPCLRVCLFRRQHDIPIRRPTQHHRGNAPYIAHASPVHPDRMDRVLASVSSLTGLTISPRGSPTASPTGSPWAPASPTTLAAGPRDRDGAAATAAIDPDEMASGWTDAAAMALTTAPAPPPPVAWDALPPPGSRHFEDVFWGPSPEEPLRGVVTLHRVVQRHLAEARDLLSLIEARAEMETGYSARLMALGRHSGHAGGPLGSGGLYNWQRHLAVAKQSLASAVGADVGVGSAAAPGAADPYHRTGTNSMNDDASSLVPLLRGMREHMVSLAATHRRHADMLQLKVVAPLQGFIERYHATLEHKYQLVTQTWKRYDSQAADVAARRTAYKVCMRQAKEEAHKFRNGGAMHERPKRPPESSLVLLGSRAVGPLELHELSTRLKREVRVQSIMTPLGVFDRCFLGDEAVNFLVHRINANVARAQYKQLLQQMLDRRMISAVVGPGLVFDLNVPYQFGQPVLKTGEPPHVKARKDAIQAELEYKHLLTKAEHDRSMLIAHITDYLLAAQRCETERLAVAHEVLQTFAATTQTHLSEATAMWHGAETLPFLQAPSAAQSVQYIATRWMTGHERPSPILFDEFEKGIHPYTLSVDAFDEEVEPSDHADHADRIDHADHAHDPAAEPSTKPTRTAPAAVRFPPLDPCRHRLPRRGRPRRAGRRDPPGARRRVDGASAPAIRPTVRRRAARRHPRYARQTSARQRAYLAATHGAPAPRWNAAAAVGSRCRPGGTPV